MKTKNLLFAVLLISTIVFGQAPSKVSTLSGTVDPAIYMTNHYYNNGTANQTTFHFPWSNTVTPDSNAYVVEKDYNFIRKITPQGVTSKYAGSDQWKDYDSKNPSAPYGYIGYGFINGTLEAARFSSIKGLASDKSGNIYVADWGNKAIRKISGNNVTTLATGFTSPNAVAADSAGNVYVADGNSVKKVTPSGTVTTITGSTAGGGTNGALILARFRNIEFITLDEANNTLYASDSDNSALRKIDLNKGLVSTITFTVDGFSLIKPSGTASGNGYLFIADCGSHVIFKFNTSSGTVIRYAGNSRSRFRDGLSDTSLTGATFNIPEGIALYPNGNLGAVDLGNSKIRLIEPLK